LVARNEDGVILGYLVHKIISSDHECAGFVVDYLTIEDNPDVFKRLIAFSIKE